MDSQDRAAITRTLKDIYAEIGAMGERTKQAILPGGRLLPRQGGTGTSQGAEPPLGNPSHDGDVLSSTIAGVRSWVTALVNPMTTKGDLIAGGASGAATRLPVGSNTQVLTADSAQTLGVKWAAPVRGANPMTTAADLIVGGTSGAETRLAKGSDGQVLTVDPTTHLLVWATPSGGGSALTVEEADGSPTDSAVVKLVIPNGMLAIASHIATLTLRLLNPMTTKGDIIAGGASGAETRLAVGSNGQGLVADSTQALGVKWAALRGANPMTTQDDLIVGGSSGAEARLAKGSDGQVLMVDPTTHHLIWVTPSSGSGVGVATYTGGFAARPTGVEGDVYFATDSPYLSRKGASAWAVWGILQKLTPPDPAAFSWLNQEAASLDTTRGGLRISQTTGTTNHIQAQVQSLPATPYTITCAFQLEHGPSVVGRAGLILRNASSGKIVTMWSTVLTGTSAPRIDRYRFSSSTVFDSAAGFTETNISVAYLRAALHWLRISDDGTTRRFLVSRNGFDFYELANETHTQYITADQVGFGIVDGTAESAHLLHWEVV